MAQHFIDFNGSPANDWPPAIKAQLAASGFNPGAGYRSMPGGRTFTMDKTIANVWSFIPLGISTADGEVLLKYRKRREPFPSAFNNTGSGVFFRALASAPNTDGFYVARGANDSANYRYLSAFYRDAAGSQTLIGQQSTALSTLHSETDKTYWNFYTLLRVRFQGTAIQARVWWEDETEPATWQLTATGSQKVAAGQVGILCHGYSELVDFAWVGVGTGTDAAPSSAPRVVSGTVRTPSGELAAGYLVRCYLRATGQLLAEGLTDANGAYTFTLQTAEKVTVVAVDQLGNVWNAPARDLITPLVV